MVNGDASKLLLRSAIHNLKLRYEQIERDREYLSQVNSFLLEDEYRAYFETIQQSKIFSHTPEFEKLIKNVEDSSYDLVINNYQKLLDNLSQGIQDEWYDFKLAIEQRLVPKYRTFLNKVDIIVRDCFYALRDVETLTGIPLSKTLPLTKLGVIKLGGGGAVEIYRNFSSFTAKETLIPLIMIPFDRLGLPWNLCAIHHEVGHALFYKLTGSVPANFFKENVKRKMEPGSATTDVIFKFLKLKVGPSLSEKFSKESPYLLWLEEIFADMVGVMLAGPAYIHSLQEISLKEKGKVFTDPNNKYLSPYFRILLNIIFAKEKLGYQTEADDLLNRWQTLYGDQHITALQEEADHNLKMLEFKQLTNDSVCAWLHQLVNACWEAGLVAQADKEISLSKIYECIKSAEYEDFFGNKKFKEEHLNQKRQDYIYKAQKALVTFKCADSRYPRYLVSALRLAYEEILGDDKAQDTASWERGLLRCFLDSVQEPDNVANFFAANHP